MVSKSNHDLIYWNILFLYWRREEDAAAELRSPSADDDLRVYSTVQQYSIVQYSTVQYSKVQYTIIQYTIIQQHSTVQYSNVLYITGRICTSCCKGWLGYVD